MIPQPPIAPPLGSLVTVEIGEVTVVGTVAAASYRPGKRELVVSLSAEALVAASPDLVKWVRVWVSQPGVPRAFALAGSVRGLERESSDLWRLSVGELAAFDETIVGGIGVRNCQPPELFYALARDIGFLPSGSTSPVGRRWMTSS